MTAEESGKKLKLHPHYRGALLNSLMSLGLLRKVNGRYSNTPFADKYFVQERSVFWTRQYSQECVWDFEALTTPETALRTGKSHEAIRGPKWRDYLQFLWNRARAKQKTSRKCYFTCTCPMPRLWPGISTCGSAERCWTWLEDQGLCP